MSERIVSCLTAMFLTWLVVCFSAPSAISDPNPPSLKGGTEAGASKGCVILLHGLARKAGSMQVMARTLTATGYTVVNQGYPSTKADLATLAETSLSSARDICDTQAPHVVTHSMGGVLLRVYAEANPDAAWGRVVMLGPPNQGSEVIDRFEDVELFARLHGPAGLQLGVEGVPPKLPALPFEAGIIAGRQSINPVLSTIVEGVDDGKVSVDHTKVAGMADHIILPVTHTFMMQNPQVLVQTLRFLETGGFDHDMTLRGALAELLSLGHTVDD